jgi:hypothetical protein
MHLPEHSAKGCPMKRRTISAAPELRRATGVTRATNLGCAIEQRRVMFAVPEFGGPMWLILLAQKLARAMNAKLRIRVKSTRARAGCRRGQPRSAMIAASVRSHATAVRKADATKVSVLASCVPSLVVAVACVPSVLQHRETLRWQSALHRERRNTSTRLPTRAQVVPKSRTTSGERAGSTTRKLTSRSTPPRCVQTIERC